MLLLQGAFREEWRSSSHSEIPFSLGGARETKTKRTGMTQEKRNQHGKDRVKPVETALVSFYAAFNMTLTLI